MIAVTLPPRIPERRINAFRCFTEALPVFLQLSKREKSSRINRTKLAGCALSIFLRADIARLFHPARYAHPRMNFENRQPKSDKRDAYGLGRSFPWATSTSGGSAPIVYKGSTRDGGIDSSMIAIFVAARNERQRTSINSWSTTYSARMPATKALPRVFQWGSSRNTSGNSSVARKAGSRSKIGKSTRVRASSK